jgi:hypothetical protein
MTSADGAQLGPALSDRALVEASFRAGFLGWLLRPYQLRIYELLWGLINRLYKKPPGAGDYRCAVLVASRKTGKSFLEALVAHEFAQRFPGAQIRLTAPTGLEARDVFYPEFEKLHELAPAQARPRKQGIDGNWRFKNGSCLFLRGADMNPNRLRGPSSDLNLFDEAAYAKRLRYVVNSVLMPMTINTRGVTILNSTRSELPDSEFNDFEERCEVIGQSAVITVYEAGFTDEQIAAERNSVDDVTWQVEYECKKIRNVSLTVVPEWTKETALSCVADPPRIQQQMLDPAWAHFGRYTAMDFGTVDNTAILSSVFDWVNGVLYVTGEVILHGAEVYASNVAHCAKMLESADDLERPMDAAATRYRIGDNNIEMLQSLLIDADLSIQSVGAKAALEVMVNTLRAWITQGRLCISPKCVNLLACLSHATWQVRAATHSQGARTRIFSRSELTDDNGIQLRHFDALAALVYLVRYVESHKDENPLPMTYVSAEQIAKHGPYSPANYVTGWDVNTGGAPAQSNGPAWLPNAQNRQRRSR